MALPLSNENKLVVAFVTTLPDGTETYTEIGSVDNYVNMVKDKQSSKKGSTTLGEQLPMTDWKDDDRKELNDELMTIVKSEQFPKVFTIDWKNDSPPSGPSLGNAIPKYLTPFLNNEVLKSTNKLKGSGYPDGKITFKGVEICKEDKTKNVTSQNAARIVLSKLPNKRVYQNFKEKPKHIIIQYIYKKWDNRHNKYTQITIENIKVLFLKNDDPGTFKAELNLTQKQFDNCECVSLLKN